MNLFTFGNHKICFVVYSGFSKYKWNELDFQEKKKKTINAQNLGIFYPKQMLNIHVSSTSILIVSTFSKPHLADYP